MSQVFSGKIWLECKNNDIFLRLKVVCYFFSLNHWYYPHKVFYLSHESFFPIFNTVAYQIFNRAAAYQELKFENLG